MFPSSFTYHRAASVEDAVRLLAENPDGKLMAGGHSLVPMMKLRLAAPPAVIDIARIADLRGIVVSDDAVRIGALTTHDQLDNSAELRQHAPLVSEAASKVGDPAVRNKGTLGGNIAHADPASDLPAALLALGASVHMVGPNGTRSIAASRFFTGLLETDLGEGEILVAVEVPRQGPGSGSAYCKLEHPASGYALCGAAAALTVTGNQVTAASLAFNGVGPVPFHVEAIGDSLVGGPPDDNSIGEAIEHHLTVEDPLGDIHASAEYRVVLASTYGKRALRLARDRALA